MATITVNGNTIEPTEAGYVSSDTKETNFILIQGFDDFTPEQKLELASLHVEVQEYVAQYTYMCRYEPEDIHRIQELPYVRSANAYYAELKPTEALKYLIEHELDREEYEIDVILHNKPNVTPQELAPYVAEKAGVPIDELEVLSSKIRLTIHQDKLNEIASLDSVNRIEEVRPKELYNDKARVVLKADALQTNAGYQGDSEVICVADTGFDQGLAADSDDIKIHPAFEGRVKQLRAFWVKEDAKELAGRGVAKDEIGHGTHVCGSIVGSGYYQASPTSEKIFIQGTAPAATLMVQSMAKWSTYYKKWILKAPGEMKALFQEPYDLGIRIHSNSWGDKWNEQTGQQDYTTESTDIDKFVYEHQDFVVVVAAGNDGDKPNAGQSQIGDNSAAKNCITVGATGSTRPNDGLKVSSKSWTHSGIADTARFSSRGPTKAFLDKDQRPVLARIKPDVVAPGVAILSAASRVLGPDDRARRDYGKSGDMDWLYQSGTSMSAPLVSGCVALIREALREKGKLRPSAALVKAILINGAVNVADKTGRGFDYEQGFGRVDIDSSIAMLKQTKYGGFVDGGSKLESGPYDVAGLARDDEWQSQPIPVPGSSNSFTATLAYSEPNGAYLQNDINLIIRAGGIEKHGNMSDSQEFDHANNVEKVIWKEISSETVTVVVKANKYLLPESVQSFAVIWSFQGED